MNICDWLIFDIRKTKSTPTPQADGADHAVPTQIQTVNCTYHLYKIKAPTEQ